MVSLRTSIIKSLYFDKQQSIGALSRSIAKSVPSVTKVIQDLVAQKLILENGLNASTGGRRAMVYSLNPEKFGCIIALAIDQHLVSIAVLNLLDNLVKPIEKFDLNLTDAPDAYEKISSKLQEVISSISTQSILGIGITIPGFVDSNTGYNHSYNKDSLIYALRERIEKDYQINTYIENDSTAIAIAEHHYGSAKNCQNALVINLNWGVGLGMIIENQLFRGHSGVAGEFSHIPLADESKLCSCGKKGCLEVEASLLCAMDYIKEAVLSGERSSLETTVKNKKTLSINEMLLATQNGDQVTIKAFKRIAKMLGKGIATLIHIMNPEKVIISGNGSDFGTILLPEIQSAVQEFCIPRLAQHTAISISNLKNVQILASAAITIKQIKKI
ncbi:ROK family protein [Sphingobacterium sp. UT-1RO-CII-1]|uniref:ROK family protein n=1 Tax=Sphingobacterium sp. UT-1RO-CII-1 TaxID=2995225 RepID=UPI00227A3B8D|nr:ROK family protein [Sphingobacterium sp. UT-1RO-CII-1]MCY4778267.1 ROK family protein [Sphingobacterium sp. UT-1RO-CII-1]